MSLAPRLSVHFVTEDDPLYVVKFFEVFLDQYPRNEVEIVGITIQRPFNESKLASARRIFSLYGLADFLRLSVRIARRKVRRYSISAFARSEGILLVPTRSVNDPDFVLRVRSLRPDVIVSVAAPEVFQQEILESARLGCINIHSGRLPAYRGMMPTFWQMKLGEQHATVTIHEMVPQIDAGAVLGTVECQIREHDSLDRLMTETKRQAAHMLIRVLRELAEGTANANSLNMTDATYRSFPTRADVLVFQSRGHRLL